MNAEELSAEVAKLKEEKELLLKLVNHDIRSPFNRIFALLQLFEMDSSDLSSVQKEYIQSIYLSTLSGLEMITNLKELREIESDEISIDKTEFDLIKTIEKSIRSFSKQTELKNQQVQTQTSLKTARVISDEYMVQRAFGNVFSNAVKFSNPGEKINISIREAKQSYIIEIQDSGKGIKGEEEHLLFQKFEKLSNTATAGEGSLGLGLYNTNNFLRSLSSKISLERRELIGSTFKIEIPRQI